MEEKIELLDVEKVDPPEEAARETIDPEKVRELAESIRSLTLLEPIIVRPRNGRFETVAGHRRLLAHRLIGAVTIKAIVRDLTDDEVFLIRAVENDQREDLNPMERARQYKKMIDRFGWTRREVAAKVGRHHNTVANYLELLEVPEDFQDAVAKKKISMDVARCLAKIEGPSFRKLYFTSAVQNGATLEVAQGWVNDYEKTRLNQSQGGDGGSPGVQDLQASLPVFGACVCCLGPVEVSKIKYIPVCPDCEGQIRGALKPKTS